MTHPYNMKLLYGLAFNVEVSLGEKAGVGFLILHVDLVNRL
jgi:hypothetical protein